MVEEATSASHDEVISGVVRDPSNNAERGVLLDILFIYSVLRVLSNGGRAKGNSWLTSSSRPSAHDAAGADRSRGERTETRTTQRSGAREKLIATTAGDLTVQVPKVRSGLFFHWLLAPCWRIDVAMHAVVGLTNLDYSYLAAGLGKTRSAQRPPSCRQFISVFCGEL